MKAQTYVEYGALLFAARKIGRPVRWTATRLESFLGDTAGRDGLLEGELALDASGKFLALRMRALVGVGAYTTSFTSIFTTANTKNCLSSVYRIPCIRTESQLVFTHMMPHGPYRGAGRPEAIYLVERERTRAVLTRARGRRPAEWFDLLHLPSSLRLAMSCIPRQMPNKGTSRPSTASFKAATSPRALRTSIARRK